MNDEQGSRYERWTAIPMALLGLLFLFVYAWPILDPNVSARTKDICEIIELTTWLIFILDYLIRLAMAPQRLRFVRRNWFDLIVLALPMLRPLRALRALIAFRTIARSGTPLARNRIVVATALLVGAGAALMALTVLEAERRNPHANIHTFGEALWWAMSTVTSVGYGDEVPVTVQGRLIAGCLMIAGFAMLGVVTAALASWFVERFGEASTTEHENSDTLNHLVDEVHQLRREVAAMREKTE